MVLCKILTGHCWYLLKYRGQYADKISTEKGKLSERIIRKATGLSPGGLDMAAGLPGADLFIPAVILFGSYPCLLKETGMLTLKWRINMISAMSNAVAALKAFDKKMAVTTNNIANWQTEGFKKSRADLKEGEAGAVTVDISVVDTPGPIVAVEENNGIVEKELSNVDLAEEIPQTIIAQTGFEANLKMLKTEDEMMGSLLDIIG